MIRRIWMAFVCLFTRPKSAFDLLQELEHAAHLSMHVIEQTPEDHKEIAQFLESFSHLKGDEFWMTLESQLTESLASVIVPIRQTRYDNRLDLYTLSLEDYIAYETRYEQLFAHITNRAQEYVKQIYYVAAAKNYNKESKHKPIFVLPGLEGDN